MAIAVRVDSRPSSAAARRTSRLRRSWSVVETESGGRRVSAAVAGAATNIVALIDRQFDALGRASATELTVLTDGRHGLLPILAAAGVTAQPILDWFHIPM